MAIYRTAAWPRNGLGLNELLAVCVTPKPAKRKHVTTAACDLRDAVLTAIRTEELDSGGRIDRIGTDEFPATLGLLDDDVEPVVISTCHRVGVRRNERTDRIAYEIAIKCNGPGSREQEHLVVAGSLASELPAESLLQIAENNANDC